MMGWDYSKIQEPCFVCKAEDELGEERGTQSHPVNCGWRVRREREGYIQTLEEIYTLCYFSDDKDLKEVIVKVKNTTISALIGRFDI